MNIVTQLERHRKKITEQWIKRVIESYPADSSKFLSVGNNRFANPIGHILKENIPIVFDEILKGESSDELNEALEAVIRLRAVQEFSASQAVGFLYQLKTLIREEFKSIAGKDANIEELLDFESSIDAAMLLAFDIFMEMKSKIYEIKSNEQRKTFSKMIDRLNKKYE